MEFLNGLCMTFFDLSELTFFRSANRFFGGGQTTASAVIVENVTQNPKKPA